MAGKRIKGRVIAARDVTIKVEFERLVEHPVLKKRHRLSFRLLADTAGKSFQVGDAVTVMECRPISRRKCWVAVSGEAL